MVEVKDETNWNQETEEAQVVDKNDVKFTCENCTLPILKEEYEISMKQNKQSLCSKCRSKLTNK
jgi:predicted SprT family Zn-dependent metalloprotease